MGNVIQFERRLTADNTPAIIPEAELSKIREIATRSLVSINQIREQNKRNAQEATLSPEDKRLIGLEEDRITDANDLLLIGY